MPFKTPSKVPSSHPPVEKGFTRVKYDDVGASTPKATLFTLEGGLKVWIPNSLHKIRWAQTNPKTPDDRHSLLDIADWFYDKNIKGK